MQTIKVRDKNGKVILLVNNFDKAEIEVSTSSHAILKIGSTYINDFSDEWGKVEIERTVVESYLLVNDADKGVKVSKIT